MEPKMQRFLVNRETGDVFIFTERLQEAFPAFADVFAKTAEDAKLKDAMPDPKGLTLEQLDNMQKVDLLLFARKKMQPAVRVDEDMTKEEIKDAIKEALFASPPEGDAPSA